MFSACLRQTCVFECVGCKVNANGSALHEVRLTSQLEHARLAVYGVRGVSPHEGKTSHSGSTSGRHVPDADNMLCAGAADPFLNDQNYVLCVLSLEELGATGNKVRPECGVKEAVGYIYQVLCCGCASTRS